VNGLEKMEALNRYTEVFKTIKYFKKKKIKNKPKIDTEFVIFNREL